MGLISVFKQVGGRESAHPISENTNATSIPTIIKWDFKLRQLIPKQRAFSFLVKKLGLFCIETKFYPVTRFQA